MKRVSTIVAVLAASLFLMSSAQANEILLTKHDSKSKTASTTQIALDVVSDGNISGIQFSIPVDTTARFNEKSLDLSKCFSELPSTHVGRCAYRPKKGDVVFIAYSTENAKLPEGVIGLGTVSLPNMAKAVKISNPVFVSASGKKVN